MRIAIATAFACGAGVWRRLLDEGHDLRVYRGAEKDGWAHLLYSHRHVGEGIVPLCDSWTELMAWLKDGIRMNKPTMMLFDSSGLGVLAEEVRAAGIYVLGGGKFMDRLEKDRSFGRDVAVRCGMKTPPYQEFSSIDQTIAFARSGKLDRPVYWKTSAYLSSDATHCAESPDELVEYLEWIKTRSRENINNVLEEKIDGIALSTARWWNGRAWCGPYEWTFERKKFMAGDVGPSTGCSLNAVGFYESEHPAIAEALGWDNLTPEFLKHDAPAGLYDVNAIVSEGEAFYLEWTPRLGWDSEGTSLPLLYDDLGRWLWYVATGQGSGDGLRDGIAFSVRLSVDPYPTEDIKRDDRASCVGVPVRGDVGDLWSEGFIGYQLMVNETGLAVAAPEGIVGLSAARGDTVSDLAEQTLSFAKDRLRIPGLQYRNDGDEAIMEDAARAEEEGISDLPEGLMA